MSQPLLSAVLKHTPVPLVRALVIGIIRRELRLHPQIFDQLGVHRGKRFRFAATDLRLYFDFQPSARSLRVHRFVERPSTAVATVTGAILDLWALLEGRLGTKGLSSDTLSVVGDEEAVLALMGTLQSCDFDLAKDVSAAAGPLARPLFHLVEALRNRPIVALEP